MIYGDAIDETLGAAPPAGNFQNGMCRVTTGCEIADEG
jgi:hypothetical protein